MPQCFFYLKHFQKYMVFRGHQKLSLMSLGPWVISEPMVKMPSPSIQIHHTGNCHWVCSVKPKDGNKVFLFDSQMNDWNPIRPCVQIQLAQAYASGSDINVILPLVHYQDNNVDCGVFAIAHAVEFFLGNMGDLKTGCIGWDFKYEVMRSHLENCLSQKKFIAFPKVLKRTKGKFRHINYNLVPHFFVTSQFINCASVVP